MTALLRALATMFKDSLPVTEAIPQATKGLSAIAHGLPGMHAEANGLVGAGVHPDGNLTALEDGPGRSVTTAADASCRDQHSPYETMALEDWHIELIAIKYAGCLFVK